jgi:hypothetical protein
MSKKKKKQKPMILESHWDVCSEYPPEDWRDEVANDDTRLGYREWVEHQIESNDDSDLTVAADEPCWPHSIQDGRMLDRVGTFAIGALHTLYKELNGHRRNPEEYGIQPREELEAEMRAIALLNNWILDSFHSQDNYLQEDISMVDIPCAGQGCDGICDSLSCDADK